MAQISTRNRLLSALTENELAQIAASLESVPLRPDETIITPFTPMTHVHFVESGLLSIVANPADREQAEIAMIGREGVCGFSIALGSDTVPFRAIVQRSGSAYRMEASAFRQACEQLPRLLRSVLLYSQVFTTQVAETSRANARHTVETRLARWLLMAHDRVDGDELPLTHECLSLMLGVRRPGITVSLHVLEGEHMIRARRGNIRILDRSKLEQAARGSYGLPEAEYERLLRPRAPTVVPAASPAIFSGAVHQA